MNRIKAQISNIQKIYLKVLMLSAFITVLLGNIALAQDTIPSVQDSLPTQKIPEKITVNNIFIIGNEKTRKNIIMREMHINQGQTYDWEEFVSIITSDQKQIYNLQLFTSVEITPLFVEEDEVELLISVKERWYIIPSIIFELADRNFSEWWINQNRDFSRVIYGLKLNHNNVGGRNEKLRVMGKLGFTQAFDLTYSIPYIDKEQLHGLAARFTYNTNKTIAIRSSQNKQVFFTNEEEEVMRKKFNGILQYTYRGSFYNFHNFTLGFSNTKVHEDVLEENPNYFLNEGTRQKFFYASYSFRHDRRDNVAYPTDGELLTIGLSRFGLFSSDDVNETEITLTASRYFRFNEKMHFVTGISASSFLGTSQPYTLVRGIGYDPNFIRGYEINVIEGQQLLIHKNSFRYRLFDIAFDTSKLIPIEEFSTFPIKAFLSANFDQGYVNDRNRLPENSALTNKYLFGYGLGIDLITFYDQVFRFEYSINNQGVGSFFINFRAPL